MRGGMIFTHLENDKFIVSNKGEGKDIEPITVKMTVKMLKELLPNAKGKKPELLKLFMDTNIAVPKKLTRPKTYLTEDTRKEAVREAKRKYAKKVKKVQPVEEMKDMEYRPKITREMRLAMERAKEPKEDPKVGEIRGLEEKLRQAENQYYGIVINAPDMFKSLTGKRKPKQGIDQTYYRKQYNDLRDKLIEATGKQYKELPSASQIKETTKKSEKMMKLLEEQKQKIREQEEVNKTVELPLTYKKKKSKVPVLLSSKPVKEEPKEESRMTGRGKKGGSVSAKDLKGLHASSYKEEPDKEVNGWVLDESISKPTARVYFNASKNQAIVVHRGTEGTVKDWANNLAFVAGVSPLTQRYKDSKEVQEKAEAKYSDVLTTGHSQGSVYTKLAKNKKGIIDVNPASFIQSTEGTTVRAKNDPVSALRGIANMFSSKGKENITTSAKANPLDAHSINILDELGDKELGTGLTKYLKGLKKGKKGGDFKSFFEKTLPRALVKQGIPILGSVAGTALGSIAGPISGAVGAEVGSKAGEVLSKYVSDKAGYGMKGGYLGQNPFPRSFGGGMTRHLKSLGQ
jgi:hypothetical protein